MADLPLPAAVFAAYAALLAVLSVMFARIVTEPYMDEPFQLPRHSSQLKIVFLHSDSTHFRLQGRLCRRGTHKDEGLT